MKISRQLLGVFMVILPAIGFSQQKNVGIRIMQNEAIALTDTVNSITLEKKSFKIQVLLQFIKGVYVFASLGDSLYNLPAAAPIPGFSDLPGLVMKEEEYNREKELLVSNEGWSYWFYDPLIGWHRFNKKVVPLDSGRVVGSKSIKQLYLLPEGRTIKLKDSNAPLYLFFVAVAEVDSSGKPLKELLRRRVKIEWNDED